MALRIVFMGSPDFALPSLKSLTERYPVVGVVTQPDRPAGRGRQMRSPAVKALADELGLPVIQPQRLSEPAAMAQMKEWQPDLIVVAAFGQILRREVLELPRHGCLNVHASLLPRWRGAAPIQAAILHGDDETGVTIMLMDAGLDTGPVLAKRALAIQPRETAGELSQRLSQLGAELLLESLPRYLSGDMRPIPQSELPGEPSYAPLIHKEHGLLDFTNAAEQLARQVRAFNPWPGAYFVWQGQRLAVLQAHSMAGIDALPGETTQLNGLPAVGTGKGLLVLDELQPAGKKAIPGKAFLHGIRGWIEGDG